MLELETHLETIDEIEGTVPLWRQEVQSHFPFWGTHEPITLFDTQKPIYAESGTPLVSHRDNPAGVETRFEARRHDAGREGEVADYAAYTEVLLSNRETLGLISFLRDGVYSYKFKNTVNGILSAMLAINGLSYFLVHKSDGPVDSTNVPVFVANASKEVRGMIAPLEEYQRNIHHTTVKSYPIPTDADLVGSTSYVDYLFRNNLLASRTVPGVSCPATRHKVQLTAGVLFDGPHEAQEQVAEIVAPLGIHAKTMNRIKKFGHAMSSGMNASIDFADIITDDLDRLTALRAGKPVWVTYEGFDTPVDLVAVYLKKINVSQAAINQSLKRRPIKPLTRSDIAKMNITVK